MKIVAVVPGLTRTEAQLGGGRKGALVFAIRRSNEIRNWSVTILGPRFRTPIPVTGADRQLRAINLRREPHWWMAKVDDLHEATC